MIQVRVNGLGELARGLRRAASGARSRAAIERVLTDRAQKVLDESNRNIEKTGHSDTGDLVDSGEVVTTKKSSKLIQVDVRYPGPYAAALHEGRGAGKAMPPKGALLGWLRRKGIDPSLEFVIRRGIKEFGSPKKLGATQSGPVKFLERAFIAERKGMLNALAVTYDQEIVRKTAEALFSKTAGR